MVSFAVFVPSTSSNVISTSLAVSASTKAVWISRVAPGSISVSWLSVTVSKESGSVKMAANSNSFPFCIAVSTIDQI